MLMQNQMKLQGVLPWLGPVELGVGILDQVTETGFNVVIDEYPRRTGKGRRPKGVRGDLDNYIKAILDAGNGMLYGDDRQVEWINGGFV